MSCAYWLAMDTQMNIKDFPEALPESGAEHE